MNLIISLRANKYKGSNKITHNRKQNSRNTSSLNVDTPKQNWEMISMTINKIDRMQRPTSSLLLLQDLKELLSQLKSLRINYLQPYNNWITKSPCIEPPTWTMTIPRDSVVKTREASTKSWILFPANTVEDNSYMKELLSTSKYVKRRAQRRSPI